MVRTGESVIRSFSQSAGRIVLRVPRTRRAEWDALRVFGMLTVFVVHVAQVFSPWQYWHIQNAERSVLAGQITLFAWPWVMPLFMFLAGAGAFLSLGYRSNAQYAWDRTVRLVIPFVIGTLLLIPPQIYVERLAQGRFEGSYFRFYPHFFECCYPEGNLAGGHLWFVAYLWVYGLASLPLLHLLSGARGRSWAQRLAAICRRRAGLLWLALPISLTQLALRTQYPQTHALINDWSNHAVLFIAYLYGFLVASNDELRRVVDAQWTRALLPAGVASAGLAWYAATSQVPGILPLPYSSLYWVFWTLFGIAAWSWIVVLLGCTRRSLRGAHHALEYMSRAVYPFYMLHQTAIVLTAYFVVHWPIAVLPKFVLLFASSIAATAVLTELARRWQPTRLIFGMKQTA